MCNHKIKIIWTTFSLAILLFTCEKGYSQSPGKRPNVIVILTDDQGYGDFACHGNPVLRTPALDKLHNESVRFSNFHVAPLCTPSRSQLMSGMDAFNNKALTVGTGRDIMRRDIEIMPEIFANNGYATGFFGKWHLGDNFPDRPMDRGFQKANWIKGWGLLSEAEFDNDYYKTRYLDSIETIYSDKYCTDLWFDESMKWMEKISAENKPFFTYLATNTPHGPFLSPERELNYYASKGYDEKTANFLGMIENIDQNMERLDKWLVEKKLKENTLVVFMTDNGSAGGAAVFNAGMRGMKGSNYDGGHRAACFIRWPEGGFKSSRTINYPAEIQDILPTFIDLFKLKSSKVKLLDGESLVPFLFGDIKLPMDRMFVVQYSEKDGPEKYFSSVVWNAWRMVGRNELYDLNNDPGQKKNLATVRPDVLNKMNAFYERWWQDKEPGLNNFIPLHIGSDKENPVILTSDYWVDSAYVNTQWKVAQGGGPSDGGTWNIHAEKNGKYLVELSRWPFHLSRKLTDIGPDKSIGGSNLRKGKKLPVEYGSLSLNGNAPVIIKKLNHSATCIPMEIEIKAGKNTLKAWFKDADGINLCGAYYVRVKKL